MKCFKMHQMMEHYFYITGFVVDDLSKSVTAIEVEYFEKAYEALRMLV